MSGKHPPARILHVHSSFDDGAKERRSARLIAAFGRDAEHAIVSGDPARRSGSALIGRQAKLSWPSFPPLDGGPSLGRLKRIAAAMAGYDLICSYDWGAIDAALAHTLFADVFKLPPLVHHEENFDEVERARLRVKRNFYRRIALGRSAALIVTSRAMERIALQTWQQPRTRVRLIPDGIATRTFAASPRRDALPRVVKHKGELWIGAIAGLSAENDLPLLVRAFSRVAEPWQLVIVGDGPERETILAQATASGVEHRVHLAGPADSARALPLFDLLALPLQREDGLPTVVEAMAAGLAVVAPKGGETDATLVTENGPFLHNPGDEAALARALETLAADPVLRQRIGDANRARATAEFDEARMIERYRALYWGLMGRN